MQLTEAVSRYAQAASEFGQHEGRQDGERLVTSLMHGLTTLRNFFYQRIREDVEINLGQDSMLMPLSSSQSEQRAKIEIEIYQTVVSSVEAERRHYVQDGAWFQQWLSELRLGDFAADTQVQRRLTRYVECTDDERRLTFCTLLESCLPEASRAPLILHRLLPLSIGMVTSVAFGASLDAAEQRNRQISWLPIIADCHECHGRPMDNGESCRTCGNPLWNYRWLTSVE